MKNCENYHDVVIVGSGPAGISAALELVKSAPELKVVIFEKGKNRKPEDGNDKDKIACGWGGAGAFSDGKLNLTSESGGLLDQILPANEFNKLMYYVDEQYMGFCDDSGSAFLYLPDSCRANDLKKRCIAVGFKNLIYYETRHWGTDNAYKIVGNILAYLKDKITVLCRTNIVSVNGSGMSGFELVDEIGNSFFCKKLIFAGGRESNAQMVYIAKDFNLKIESNGVDIGVRVETANEAFEDIIQIVRSPKLVVQSGKEEVRTFCVCPEGFVKLQSSYGALTVNGESFSRGSDTRSPYTNFAILVHSDFTHPFSDPIVYGGEIAKLTNMLGGNRVIVQTLHDLLEGQRSTQVRLQRNVVKPTLKDAEPANLGRAIPHDFMRGILKMIDLLMKITLIRPNNTILYGPEIKQYAQRVELDRNCQTKERGFYIVGDGSGWTRGILQSSMMGIIAARHIAKNL